MNAVRGVVVIAAVLGASLVYVGGGSRAASAPLSVPVADDVPGSAQSRPGRLVRELPELRTRKSRTYEAADGSQVTRVFSVPVNYRATDGSMDAIDLSLRSVSGGYGVSANGYGVSLPARLEDAPVRVSDGSDWVSFSLKGGAGAAVRDENAARYEDVRPGVDAVYTVGRQALREELVLADASATRSFAFTVKAAAGLRARLGSAGQVSLEDADGTERMALAAPFMSDAAGEKHGVDTALSKDDDGGWTLTYRPDDGWLDSPKRSWPVTVDPSVYPTPDRDCWIENLPATVDTSFCASDSIEVGYGPISGQPAHDHRGLLHFDIAQAVPADATVLWARATMWFRAQTTTTAKPITLHRMTSAWTSGATWNRSDGTNAWATAGGDHAAAPEVSDDQRAELVGGAGVPVNKDYQWDITGLAREWASGQTANNGVMLRDDPAVAQSNNVIQFTSGEHADTAHLPFIDLQYTRKVGERRGYAQERWQLNDRMQLSVNPAGGNAMLSERDLTVPGGSGPDMDVTRTYNSRGGNSFYVGTSGFGDRWTASFGDGYRLRTFEGGDKDAYLTLPSGAIAHYQRVWSGGSATNAFTTPAGFNNKLVRNGDGSYTLTEDASQYKHIFDSAGRMTREQDRNGRGINYTWSTSGARVDAITDSQSRVTNLTWGSNGQITKMVDPAGREYLYGYDATYPTILRTYTDPEGGVTQLEYYGEGPKKITTPGGRVTNIDYYAAGHVWAGKVKWVIRKTASTTDVDPKWEFFYDEEDRDGHGKTRVRDPRGNDTTYTFDTKGRVTEVKDALDRSAKRTYTSNSNVDEYTAPNNTGLTPNTKLTYDSATDNQTDSSTETSNTATEALKTHADYGPTGVTDGAAYLPKLIRDEQDTASSSATRGTAIDYDAKGNPTRFAKDTTSSVEMSYQLGADGKSGRLHSTTDPNGNVTVYGYDAKDNLTSVNPPAITAPATDLGTTSLEYGGASGADQALSRITRVIDGRTNKAEYEYDDLDRIVKLTYRTSGGTEVSRFEYVYDGDGNLTQRTDFVNPTKIYTFTYDDLNRVTQELLPGSVTNLYSYDAASNLASMQDAGGTVSYTYDEINRQKTIQEPGAASAISFSYLDTPPDADPLTVDHGQKNTITLPNGVATVNILDRAGRLLRTESKRSTTVVQRFLYEYQLASGKQQRLVSRETDMASVNVDYLYDPLDRLLSATNSATADDFAYRYDAAGNILTKTKGGGTPDTYCYNQANQICWRKQALYNPYTSAPACGSAPNGATIHTYDEAGEQLTGSGATATYNREMQMTAFGATSFAYAGPGQAQRTAIGSTSVINNLLGVGSYTAGSTVDYFTRDENKAFISQRRPSAGAPNRRTYPLSDRLGSTRTLTNENGIDVRRYNYEPYGGDIPVAGSWTTTTPLQFAGGERDATGLYHFGQRYYDPAIGRWTQQDPLNQASDMRQANRYTYAAGDPINITDPSGEIAPAVAIGLFAGRMAIQYGGRRAIDKAGYDAGRAAASRLGVARYKANQLYAEKMPAATKWAGDVIDKLF